jgi:peptidoglycan/xylan/chitin deacetylase (PgdA/CDA1 family)
MNGIFTISLDFELHWGGFEKWPLEKYQSYFMNTRAVIPRLLSAFEESGVHVTWATVGMLFHDSRHELLANAPVRRPGYKTASLSAYQYIESTGIGENELSDPFHYAPSLINKIIAVPGQELATHTFAHYYCNEEGQTIDQFRDDIRAAQRAAAKYGRNLQSLVFPRNQFNEQYLRACYQEGIRIVRSNPLDWFWNIGSTQNESTWKRLNRGLDAYLPIGKQNTYSISSLIQAEGLPVSLPASRLLRPYNPKEFLLNDLKIERIKNEMSRAAQNGEIYHLWWHPHNFGNFPDESMDGLLNILDQYKTCARLYNMNSLNMGEIADVVR